MKATGNSKAPIYFFCQGTSFSLKGQNVVRSWILSAIKKEKKKAGDISFVFCNDRFLLALNKKFLKHNTLTDIITFQYPSDSLTADIYISTQRVKENAKKYAVSFENELHRVMIHGILHLCGYSDKSPAKKAKMRTLEDHYLRLLKK